LIFVSIIFYYSFGAIKITMMSVSANTGLNMGIIYLVFPIAAILLIYGYIYRLIKNILFIKNPSEKKEGGKQI
jgi:TRAP-type C4-dicarboxylate transport system permease small subunit